MSSTAPSEAMWWLLVRSDALELAAASTAVEQDLKDDHVELVVHAACLRKVSVLAASKPEFRSDQLCVLSGEHRTPTS